MLQPQFEVEGFRELLISVRDLSKSQSFYTNVLGYEAFHEGSTDEALLRAYQLKKGARGREVLLRNPGDETGYVRLVAFDGVKSEPIRSGGQAWDTGGIFDFNLRVRDMMTGFRDFQSAGWNGLSDPIRYQFGPFDVSEVLMRGPDNVIIATMQRHAPPLTGFPNLRRFSQVFNSTHVSRDARRALQFFTEQLGWKIYLETVSEDRKAGPNVLGFPHNSNAQIRLPVYIVHPQGTNLGSIEFIEVQGLTGRDFSDRAHPPNLGLLLYRFPVKNLSAYAKFVVENGVDLRVPTRMLELLPYGRVALFAVQSPDGVWLEFFEPMD